MLALRLSACWPGEPAGERQAQSVLDRREDADGRGRGAGRPGWGDCARDGSERLGAASYRRCPGAQGSPRAAGGADPDIGRGGFLRHGTERSPARVSVGRVSADGNTPGGRPCRDHDGVEAASVEAVANDGGPAAQRGMPPAAPAPAHHEGGAVKLAMGRTSAITSTASRESFAKARQAATSISLS